MPEITQVIKNYFDMVPDQDDTLNLGSSELRFKNLFLSGNLSDGTNTTTIANLITHAVRTPVAEESPTDSGDHLNFTILHTPSTGTFKLFRNGVRQQTTTDFTLTGADLVLIVALATGEVLFCDYEF